MPAGRTAGPGAHWMSAKVTSLLSILSIVWDIAIEALLSRPQRLRFLVGEEVANDHRDFRSTALEREMTGVEQVDFGVRVVASEGLPAGRKKGSFLPHTARSGGRCVRKYSRRTNLAGSRHCLAGRGAQSRGSRHRAKAVPARMAFEAAIADSGLSGAQIRGNNAEPGGTNSLMEVSF